MLGLAVKRFVVCSDGRVGTAVCGHVEILRDASDGARASCYHLPFVKRTAALLFYVSFPRRRFAGSENSGRAYVG